MTQFETTQNFGGEKANRIVLRGQMRRVDSGLLPEQQAEGSERRKDSQWCKNEDEGSRDMSMAEKAARR